MEKQQIISFINEQLVAGKISKEDIFDLAKEVGTPVQKEESSKNLIGTFYAIGAIIAVIGIGILLSQHWDEIGFAGRILVTLGISLMTYIVALLLNKHHHKMVSQVLFTISAALAPLGSYVLLKQAGINFDLATEIILSLILFVIYGVALLISKRNILVLITIGFATWTYYAITMKVFGFNYYANDFLQWASMLIGASYILIAYGYQSLFRASDESDFNEKRAVQNVLFGLGTLAILGAGISVGGIFDLFFIILIFAAFYGSVYVKSRAMLTFAALFLVAHIIKLTSKYFVNSTGWPLALILVGFLVIGIGYLTFYLNRKFISSK